MLKNSPLFGQEGAKNTVRLTKYWPILFPSREYCIMMNRGIQYVSRASF